MCTLFTLFTMFTLHIIHKTLPNNVHIVHIWLPMLQCCDADHIALHFTNSPLRCGEVGARTQRQYRGRGGWWLAMERCQCCNTLHCIVHIAHCALYFPRDGDQEDNVRIRHPVPPPKHSSQPKHCSQQSRVIGKLAR